MSLKPERNRFTVSGPKMFRNIMITYRIPISGLKKSTNKIYAGEHWSKRKEFKDSVFSYARYFCRPIKEFGPYPVEISYKFFFTSRALDTLNCAYMAKCFEDALHTLGVLEDDDPKHVAKSCLEVIKIDKKKTALAVAHMGPAQNAKNEDWLEITINKYN